MLEGEKGREPSIEAFLGDPTRDLEAWAWLWTGDHQFPPHSPPGFFGRLRRLFKRLLRPILKFALADLWDRQRVFNLILLENFAQERAFLHQSIESHQRAIEAHAALLEGLDHRVAQSMTDVMGHNDALFARVDQKLDRYRREAKDLWHRLGALIAAGEEVSSTATSSPAKTDRRDAQQEQEYLELEKRYRGSEQDIAERIATYLPHLEKVPGEVLDLGCGRGEALDVLGQHGIDARGIDSSREMVALCREKGLRADEGDLLDSLTGLQEASLGAVVSFHVIEHLPTDTVERLIRLAWKALRPGGVLVLETPSPMSMVMASRDFWIDPTHRRPVHPASLEVTFREAGFEPVQRLDLHPFESQDRLPEINLDTLADDQKALADQVNRLRDLLDDLLFGDRDFAMIGVKPAAK